jgi:hypothetical protein
MKRIVFLLLALVPVVVLLSGCSTGPVRRVYATLDDVNFPQDSFEKTTKFAANDDLSIVVELNTHQSPLRVRAIFQASQTGQVFYTDEITADENVGEVYFSLFVGYLGSGRTWPDGKWTVEVYVDDKKEETLTFTVLPSVPVNP